MSLVQVNSQEIQVKEYRGGRVVTFKDIDLVHNRPKGTASRTFTENKKHFIKNEDYFYLNNAEIQSTKIVNYTSPKGLTLITETGYLMLVKSFSDDLAWKVQRELVNNYFKTKQEQQLTQLDLFNQMVNTFNEQQQKITQLENKVEYLSAAIIVNDNQTLRQKLHSTVASWAYKNQLPVGVVYNNLYSLINKNLHLNIKSRATRHNLKPIDILEELNLLEYALRAIGEAA